ncbi:MAG TPA: hypothetical protein VMV00_02410 [Candidatus Baltobacteraceae bacterium]|nr:hypothetical protein [Candidatus Baltobacteraceae bacterium]
MGHKGQTSIEFMVLLAASASLGVVGLAMYQHLSGSQSAVFSSILNASGSAHTAQYHSTNGSYSASLSLGGTSYLNRSNGIYLLVTAPYGAYIARADINSTGGTVSPGSYNGTTTDGITLMQFSFIPSQQGSGSVSASVNVSYNGTTRILRSTAYTYSIPFVADAPSGGTGSPQFSAAITTINQSITYPLAAPINISYVTQWSHCTFHNLFGTLSYQGQCGDANWDYVSFSESCYYESGVTTATYCMKLDATQSSYSTISGTQGYIYAIELRLYNQTMSLSALANSSSAGPRVLDGSGIQAGNATVSAVSGIGSNPSQGYVVLNVSNAERVVGISSYQPYAQALNNLDSVLGYYNQSGAQGSDVSSIQDAIDGYNNQVLQFTNASNAVNPQCTLSAPGRNQVYACAPVSGLYYTINATVSGVKSPQLLSVAGSTVDIR